MRFTSRTTSGVAGPITRSLTIPVFSPSCRRRPTTLMTPTFYSSPSRARGRCGSVLCPGEWARSTIRPNTPARHWTASRRGSFPSARQTSHRKRRPLKASSPMTRACMPWPSATASCGPRITSFCRKAWRTSTVPRSSGGTSRPTRRSSSAATSRTSMPSSITPSPAWR